MDETLKNILIGVEMTGREIAAVFDRHGISKINPVKEKFDYNLHQAMFEVSTDEVESGTVVEVVQPGYQLHDRLLRPAMVGYPRRHRLNLVHQETINFTVDISESERDSALLLHEKKQVFISEARH